MPPLNATILPFAYRIDFVIIYTLFGDSSISMKGKQKVKLLKRSFVYEHTLIWDLVFLKEIVDFYETLSLINVCSGYGCLLAGFSLSFLIS